jgi:hypothetical protein
MSPIVVKGSRPLYSDSICLFESFDPLDLVENGGSQVTGVEGRAIGERGERGELDSEPSVDAVDSELVVRDDRG